MRGTPRIVRRLRRDWGRAILVALLPIVLLGPAGCASDAGPSSNGSPPAAADADPIDLAAVALAASDVGEAEVKTDAAIQAPPGANASYHRLLAPGTTVGRSTFELLESTVTEFDGADEAEGFLSLVGRSLTPSFFEEVIQRSAGFQVDNLTGTSPDVRLGDQSSVALARFDAVGGGTFEAMFVFVRVGRLVQALFAVTKAGQLDAADVAGLAGTVAARMRDAQPEAA